MNLEQQQRALGQQAIYLCLRGGFQVAACAILNQVIGSRSRSPLLDNPNLAVLSFHEQFMARRHDNVRAMVEICVSFIQEMTAALGSPSVPTLDLTTLSLDDITQMLCEIDDAGYESLLNRLTITAKCDAWPLPRIE